MTETATDTKGTGAASATDNVGVTLHQPSTPRLWELLPVTEYTVAWAYRLLLGREPESQAILADHAANTENIAQLRERFMQSSEFLEISNASKRDSKLGNEAANAVQVNVDAATQARLLEHIAESWTRLGNTEPYWSVLSEADYTMDRIGESRDAFLESGREHVERMHATFARCGIRIDPAWSVMELGCGLGRITRWLADEFNEVFAYDISAPHLDLARQINADAAGFQRIHWRQLRNPQDIESAEPFDLFFSVIVLQHNPPPVIATLLDSVARKLKPGGVTFFQVPTWHRDYWFDAAKYLDLRGEARDIEMHVLPQAELFRIFAAHGCESLEVFEDELSGSRATQRSNTFVFRKQADHENPAG